MILGIQRGFKSPILRIERPRNLADFPGSFSVVLTLFELVLTFCRYWIGR